MGTSLTVLVDEVEEKVIHDLNELSKELSDLHREFIVASPVPVAWTGKAANQFDIVFGQNIIMPLDAFAAELTLLGVTLRTALDAIKQADEFALAKAGEFQDAIDAVQDFENL